mgnify:CR=1 FL=1
MSLTKGQADAVFEAMGLEPEGRLKQLAARQKSGELTQDQATSALLEVVGPKEVGKLCFALAATFVGKKKVEV